MSNRRLISYSLWGQSKLYLQGMIDSIPIAHQVYPDFDVRVYCAKNCPALPNLRAMEKTDSALSIVEMPEAETVWGSTTDVAQHRDETHCNMIWRYLAYFDEAYDYVLTRDCDSRVCERESVEVYDWINSTNNAMLLLYDHPAHLNGGVMPGLAAARSKAIRGLFWDFPLENYLAQEKSFRKSYSADNAAEHGVRFVHYDIHHFRYSFMKKQLYWEGRGYGSNKPLRRPMPAYGSCGEMLGATVHEEWRYLSFQ
jgi:hypothetical protein